ncbi:hypothetical protein BG011_000265 [Mortierella polycephala]|uniref:C2H2-type domain-containing protein n=1 Tax=Mortierella polycephala TaxID=41804 RepID=A0A9P6TVX9_9FUNG|nr:hypothetical protein BG011_000265 [Mortierella polycephala]
MSTATSLPTLSTQVQPSSNFYFQMSEHVQRSSRSDARPQAPVLSSSPQTNYTETEAALYQQSKRLAGLSITNCSGTKVSILNESASEDASSSRQDLSKLPPHPPSPLVKENAIHEHQQHRRHYHQQSSLETARSSSLTNASTPIYPSLELDSTKSPKSLTTVSQRSRSLSNGAKLAPHIPTTTGATASRGSSPSAGSPTHPFFARSHSEDNASDDPESQRRMSDPAGSSGAAGPAFVKRKYSCSYPGCNKCFTTSGHLARHNRIHTGERNFACLMPGCPSKFSRQDNMMQHYRTHISPKSRRGIPKKQEYYALGHAANGSQEGLLHGSREQSPAIGLSGSEHGKHQHIAKMTSSRHGSRQGSPPRFSPFDRSNSVDYTGRNATESYSSTGTLRHKHSAAVQAHQHHTPLPHFNVHNMTMAYQSIQPGHASTPQSAQSSPVTPTVAQAQAQPYHHSPAYPAMSHTAQQQQQQQQQAHPQTQSSSHDYRPDAMFITPNSPITPDVERMEGVASSLDQHRRYHGQQPPHVQAHEQQYQNSYSNYQQQQHQHPHQHQSHSHHIQSSHPTHAGHAYPSHHHNNFTLPPLPLHGQERQGSERPLTGHSHVVSPPSPQPTPHTPTKYRFDPIQDCLQQGKQHQQPYDVYHPQYQSRIGEASQEDEDASVTTRSSIISSTSSMTSISSASSSSHIHSSQQHQHQHQQQHESVKDKSKDQQQSKQEPAEEMSGLAHLAQIVTTYG